MKRIIRKSGQFVRSGAHLYREMAVSALQLVRR